MSKVVRLSDEIISVLESHRLRQIEDFKRYLVEDKNDERACICWNQSIHRYETMDYSDLLRDYIGIHEYIRANYHIGDRIKND